MLFADLLDVYTGEEAKVLNWARGHPDITLIFGPSNAPYCRGQGMRQLEFDSNRPTVADVAAKIAGEISAIPKTTEIPYVTFSRYLLIELANELGKQGIVNVKPVHWNDQFPPPGTRVPTRAESVKSISNAQVDDLVAVLSERRVFSEANSAFMSALRPLFIRKFGGKYAKHTVGVGEGFFSALIQRAVALNKVKASNLNTVRTRVWIESNAALPVATTSRGIDVTAQAAQITKIPEAENRGSVYPPEWDARFADASLGPFPNFRSDLFRELERLVDGKRTGYTLIQETIDSVRKGIDDARLKRSDSTERPAWLSAGASERFLKAMLCRNEVFIDQNEGRFRLSPAKAFVSVVKLVPTFKDVLEQDLLLHLVAIQTPFTIDDLSKAAVFLFGKRNPRDTKRLEDLMVSLVASNKVAAQEDAWVVVSA